MPVTTRSQARTSTSSSLTPLKSSTFPTSSDQPLESELSSFIPIITSTNLITESLSIPGQPSLTSTSLPLEHSNKSQLDTPIIYPTSLSHDNQSSSLDQAILKSESEFEISNFSNFQNLESSMGLPLKSHNSSVSDFSIMDDDESAEYLSQTKACYAKTSQDLLDMNSLFESIKVHLTNVTEKVNYLFFL